MYLPWEIIAKKGQIIVIKHRIQYYQKSKSNCPRKIKFSIMQFNAEHMFRDDHFAFCDGCSFIFSLSNMIMLRNT